MLELAKWVPKYLNPPCLTKKSQLVLSCHAFCNTFGETNSVSKLETVDEMCVHIYYPETKQLSMQWQHSGSPHPKTFKAQKSAWKVLATVSLA